MCCSGAGWVEYNATKGLVTARSITASDGGLKIVSNFQ